jgi:hypothetical protein
MILSLYFLCLSASVAIVSCAAALVLLQLLKLTQLPLAAFIW